MARVCWFDRLHALVVEKLPFWLGGHVHWQGRCSNSRFRGGCWWFLPVLAFFFGIPGSLNDINVLDRSPLLHNHICGRSISVEYEVNGNKYNIPYWLGDGIYPNYHCFVKSISNPQSRKEQMFSKDARSQKKRYWTRVWYFASTFSHHYCSLPVVVSYCNDLSDESVCHLAQSHSYLRENTWADIWVYSGKGIHSRAPILSY